MSKILQSLPLTIVAGIVLTVIMAYATEYMTRTQHQLPGTLEDAKDKIEGLIH